MKVGSFCFPIMKKKSKDNNIRSNIKKYSTLNFRENKFGFLEMNQTFNYFFNPWDFQGLKKSLV